MFNKNFKFTGTIIGGAALNMLEVSNRLTKDIDFIDPNLAKQFLELGKEFRLKNPELKLNEEWINNGPINLKKDLPELWENRVVKIFSGKAMMLWTLGRSDLLKTKLYAYCDRDIDLQDCIELKPTVKELDNALNWLIERDSNPLWPNRVKEQVIFLKEKLNG